MAAFIKGVFSVFPETSLSEAELLEVFRHESFGYDEELLGRLKRVLHSVELHSRPSVVNFEQFTRDLDEDKCPCTIVKPGPDNLFRGAETPFKPTLSERATVWEAAAKDLSLRAVQGVIEKTGTTAQEIDCVLTNTSTGVILPNLSSWIPHQLNLTNVKSHYSLDNTGCGGAIACLDVARSIVLSGRASCLLILTVDCCTPHINTHPDLDMEALLPNLLFGDGAGAILVSSKEEKGSWKLDEPECFLLGKDTSDFINLRVTDQGYFLKLSKDLTAGLHSALSSQWTSILSSHTPDSIPASVEWVVHPGGKAILEVFKQQDPPLSDHDLRHALTVMREKGNMVSTTLVSVLELMMKEHSRPRACLVGPGPGVEVKILSIHEVL